MPKAHNDISQGLTDTIRPHRWIIVGAVAGLISAVLYACGKYFLVDVNPELSEVAVDVFGKYLVLVVAVERAAAVFVGMFRNQNTVDWSLRINRISEVLKKEKPPIAVLKQVHAREQRLVEKLEADSIIATIDSVPESPDATDYLGYLTSAKHAYEFQRARFNSVSNRYVALAVFVVGILLAALGLSVFRDVFQPAQELGAVQTGGLRLLDIFVTGGLLGGGSAGLNAVVTKVSEFIDRK